MAIEINIYDAESVSFVNVSVGDSKWIQFIIRDSVGEMHEVNIFSVDKDKPIAMFLVCNAKE